MNSIDIKSPTSANKFAKNKSDKIKPNLDPIDTFSHDVHDAKGDHHN